MYKAKNMNGHRNIFTMAIGSFAAERPAGRRYPSTAVGTTLQAPALSSKCR